MKILTKRITGLAALNCGLVLMLLIGQLSGSAAEVDFQAGDRVLFLGNTVIERAQESEHLETQLTVGLAKRGIEGVTFRNLGWSGDSVFGDARAYFGPPAEGIERLQKQVAEWKPTVILVCYGAVAAFEGEAGLANFLSGYRSLLDVLEKESGAREVVLLSPPPVEGGPGLPDPAEQNARLAMYSEAIGVLAKERRYGFVDWFSIMGAGKPFGQKQPCTDNGLHFTDYGYFVIGHKACRALGLEIVPPSDPYNALRKAIKEKNRLFFHRWRPVNETYLFGFRAHEQGQNAKEIPMFDPLILAAEQRIAELAEGFGDE
jgi:lysophospholipase L1-like esterase